MNDYIITVSKQITILADSPSQAIQKLLQYPPRRVLAAEIKSVDMLVPQPPIRHEIPRGDWIQDARNAELPEEDE